MLLLLPLLFASIFGWVIGHLFALCDRAPERQRRLNYALGMAGAAAGALLSSLAPVLYNKLLAISLLAAVVTLALFHGLRRVSGMHPG
ncbi:MAG: hypothetical protein ONB48_20475 [candidate division KSB1 bacterium]|nr:hypothetical protein [candidate division KSB1 bacterium]MDZ7273363.1 hypothetical protein [candidate division KSB1 bacterium]MDZ7288025.1 hypothetical protein [candidate division KSB1 bacterium]MDZ7300123.1 hypothetical protein [candidate division KSB1 bacterium]MDZ7308885.1 hypothetical protein [candidate division KSB1 bacterium]